MADSGAAKIQSPTLRDCIAQQSRAVRLCFGKSAVQCGVGCSCAPLAPSGCLQGCPPPCLPAELALAHILQVRGPPSVWRKACKS